MKYKICDECGEIVTKTGFISSSDNSSKDAINFAKCHNKDCGKLISKVEYEKLQFERF